MISVEEATAIVARWAHALPTRRLRLDDLLGLRLAQDVASRVDSPPFDKSMVDGFAISTGDKSPTLRVTEMVTAGAVPAGEVTPGTAIRVMTGAPVPRGADAVVKWEDCKTIDDATLDNPARLAKPGGCVLKRGAAFQTGQVVLRAGASLGPLAIALLAEIGEAEVAVTPRPRVAVLPTGDELVAAHEACGPGRIRNSNGPMLIAAVQKSGATAVDLGVARDTPKDLSEKIAAGLGCDVLLVSGGVSAGVKDLVPGALAELGVAECFHQVRMKPGKPLWFGVRDSASSLCATGVSPVGLGVDDPLPRSTGDTPVAHVGAHEGARRTLVFGLPGNPVSTFVAFKLFVEPALAALAGAPFAAAALHRGVLAAPFKHRGGRPTYFPCRWASESAGTAVRTIEPLDWRGSADLATLTRADCLAAFPAGDYELAAGDAVEWMAL
jgi:molybdopterin molybdotransferase